MNRFVLNLHYGIDDSLPFVFTAKEDVRVDDLESLVVQAARIFMRSAEGQAMITQRGWTADWNFLIYAIPCDVQSQVGLYLEESECPVLDFKAHEIPDRSVTT